MPDRNPTVRINFVTYKECLYKECHGTSEHRENCSSLSDCYLHISKDHLAHR
jgi:hypothetical protein